MGGCPPISFLDFFLGRLRVRVTNGGNSVCGRSVPGDDLAVKNGTYDDGT